MTLVPGTGGEVLSTIGIAEASAELLR
jgi:hypothetical protein